MEYNIVVGCMEHTEFFEGVRALLIDKDKSPKWKHASIRDVTPEDVAFFFDRNDQMNLDISKSINGIIDQKATSLEEKVLEKLPDDEKLEPDEYSNLILSTEQIVEITKDD